MIAFRSFRSRLLVLILGLAGISQLAAFLIVARVHRANALSDIHLDLKGAADRFSDSVKSHNDILALGAKALSFDTGLRDAISETDSATTLQSGLVSMKGRLEAGLVTLLSVEGKILAATEPDAAAGVLYTPLFTAADNAASGRASGYGMIAGQLYSLTVVPLRPPDVLAWIVVGFPLDQAFVTKLGEEANVMVSLRLGDRILARTPPASGELVTELVELPTLSGPRAEIVLQYALEEKLVPARRLEKVLIVVGAGSLGLAALVALGIARGVSRPVRQLAAHTAVIARGDYETRLHLDSQDELGQLAESFNAMSSGLAERDRVRDLLDKNVSPEVATQLLRDGAALGGEEREVTILFADLRGFTTFSERLAPRDVVAQLNRYLDRMSAEIERHDGVIDKFIGDEIMALFGAPVTQADSADRALAAALAMQAALGTLNEELAAEGKPPMATGIGINTARVVAGNIGSHRRLNYSVIGDGVNVAARLQTLTRNPDYAASVIVSAATRAAAKQAFAFRPLGPAVVKGRSEPIGLFALDRRTGA